MAERDNLTSPKEADVERSTKDIRRDIAKGEKDISKTVEQIGERIKDKLDWRGYVKDSPYWALGAAAGLGYLASGIFRRRATPMERIAGSIAEKVRDPRGGMLARATRPGLIKMTLLSIATKAVAGWLKNVASTAVAGDSARPRPQTAHDSTISPTVGK